MINPKFALRTLFKTPFVTIVAIVSLALGIGANAAIFSCFNQILLESLSVPEANRLVNLAAPGPKPGSHSCNQAGDCDEVFSYAMFRDLQTRADDLYRRGRASDLRREPLLSGTDAERNGNVGVGQLFPGAPADAGAGPPHRTGRRQGGR